MEITSEHNNAHQACIRLEYFSLSLSLSLYIYKYLI
jgi:hypothetical protein